MSARFLQPVHSEDRIAREKSNLVLTSRTLNILTISIDTRNKGEVDSFVTEANTQIEINDQTPTSPKDERDRGGREARKER